LKLVGVKHLFVVPHIRTSSYVQMLSEVLPELRNSSPGAIQEPALPELRNLVVVDNQRTFLQQINELQITSTIDWREILIWREDVQERRLQRDIAKLLTKDDVINLQFTRSVLYRFSLRLPGLFFAAGPPGPRRPFL
jgi:hypothetical protein